MRDAVAVTRVGGTPCRLRLSEGGFRLSDRQLRPGCDGPASVLEDGVGLILLELELERPSTGVRTHDVEREDGRIGHAA
jgi:hypothetical protein